MMSLNEIENINEIDKEANGRYKMTTIKIMMFNKGFNGNKG